MKKYRVMCQQETGEGYCLANGVSRAMGKKLMVAAAVEHPEWSGFALESESRGRCANDYFDERGEGGYGDDERD